MSFIPGLVSVIVLTYNSERYIARCLNALAAQTYKDFEVVLVDAGSKDRTCEITDSYRYKIRIVWIDALGTNMGQARNIGIRNANGEFLAYCDSDDLFEPGKLGAGVDALRTDLQAHVAYGAAAHFRAESPGKVYLSRSMVIVDDAPAKHLIRAQTININTLLVRRGDGCDVYFQDDSAGKYGEDWQYLISLVVERKNFKHVDGVYSLIEVRDDSHTSWDIQYLMKWYVIKQIVINKTSLLALGCPKYIYTYNMIKHWLKFLLSLSLINKNQKIDNKMIDSVKFMSKFVFIYIKYILPIISNCVAPEFIKKIWLINRRRKMVDII